MAFPWAAIIAANYTANQRRKKLEEEAEKKKKAEEARKTKNSK